MKLLRYGPVGQEKPGLLDAEGRIRDLSGHLADLGPDALGRDALARSRRPRCRRPAGGRRVAAPRHAGGNVGKFIAIGLNFADHAAESNLPVPKEPIVFNKAITSLSGPNDPVMLPKDSGESDWEVELGIVIGTRASYVEEAQASITWPAIA